MAGTESNIKDREHEDSPFVNNKKRRYRPDRACSAYAKPSNSGWIYFTIYFFTLFLPLKI